MSYFITLSMHTHPHRSTYLYVLSWHPKIRYSEDLLIAGSFSITSFLDAYVHLRIWFPFKLHLMVSFPLFLYVYLISDPLTGFPITFSTQYIQQGHFITRQSDISLPHFFGTSSLTDRILYRNEQHKKNYRIQNPKSVHMHSWN